MTAPTITIENERGVSVAIPPDAMPEPPITFGVAIRRDVTRYSGRNVSTQVLGTTYAPTDLSGVLDDSWLGVAGAAKSLRAQLEALVESGTLIGMTYDSDQWWGWLDVTFEEETPTRIGYTLAFEPLYRERPRVARVVLSRAPVDTSSAIEAELAALDALIADPPGEVSPDLAGRLLVAVLAAENALSEVVTSLDGVTYFADLSVELAGQIARTTARSISKVGDVIASVRTVTEDALAVTTGVPGLVASAWRDDVLAQAQASRAALLAFMVELRGVEVPDTLREHVVRTGETLVSIAGFYYGDFTLWTRIADANDLEGSSVSPGTVIKIPDLDEALL